VQRLVMGIDTGGTNTDAVVLSLRKGEVLTSAKALTTRADLAVGIAEAVRRVREVDRSAIALTHLSTTLATNEVVEGHGGRVCLPLIGYDQEMIDRFGFQRDLVTNDVEFIGGGHDIYGREVRPLDEEAVRRSVAEGPPECLQEQALVDFFASRSDDVSRRYGRRIELERLKPSTGTHNAAYTECQEFFGAITLESDSPLGHQIVTMLDVAVRGVGDQWNDAVIENTLGKSGPEVENFNRLPLNAQSLVGSGM